MTEVVLHGFAGSTYVRTVRLACEEKGVPYAVTELAFGSDEHRALHPFLKMPAMVHGDVHLFEAFAIARYVDEAFDGLPLQPAEPVARALMTQWVSAIVDYVYPVLVRGLVLPRLVYPSRGTPVDEAALKANLTEVAYQLSVLDGALRESPYFAGNALSLADLFAVPILAYVAATPEGSAALERCAAVARWQETMAARQSFGATQPQLAA